MLKDKRLYSFDIIRSYVKTVILVIKQLNSIKQCAIIRVSIETIVDITINVDV